MKSLSVAFFVIVYTFSVIVISSLQIFPWFDDTAYGFTGITEEKAAAMTGTTQQLTAQTSGVNTDIITILFQQVGFNILTSVGTIVRSIIYVEDLLVNTGVPQVLAWAVQRIIWVVYSLDAITLWRGIVW